MINLQIDHPLPDSNDKDNLIRAAEESIKIVTGSTNKDLSLILTDDTQLHELNRQFRGIDTSTDVLSFSDGEVDPDSRRPYLGDVLISIPRAEAQAITAGHSLRDELQLLIVHGVLHLLGYDHNTEGEKKRMWEYQSEILNALGCAARSIE